MTRESPLTIAEAARLLGRSEDQTRRYFDAGKVTGFRTSGGVRLLDRASVEALGRQFANVEALNPTNIYRSRRPGPHS